MHRPHRRKTSHRSALVALLALAVILAPLSLAAQAYPAPETVAEEIEMLLRRPGDAADRPVHQVGGRPASEGSNDGAPYYGTRFNWVDGGTAFAVSTIATSIFLGASAAMLFDEDKGQAALVAGSIGGLGFMVPFGVGNGLAWGMENTGLKVVAVAVDVLYNAAAFGMLLLIADESNRL